MRKDEIGHAKVKVKMKKNNDANTDVQQQENTKLIDQNCKIFKNDGDSRRC